jgi:hypothetical protein
VVLVGLGPEPDRDTRGDDQLALEEIRRLFDRYRKVHRVRLADNSPRMTSGSPREIERKLSEIQASKAGRGDFLVHTPDG